MIERVNNYLETLFRWPTRLGKRITEGMLDHYCYIGINAGLIDFIHAKKNNNKIELLSVNSIPIRKGINLTSQLETIVSEYHLKNMSCAWVLEPKQYQLLMMESLPVTPDEFQSAIRWKIKTGIPFPLEEAVIDYFTLPLQKTREAQEMMMVVVSKLSYLETLSSDIKSSGLILKTIDIQELALHNIAALSEKDQKSCAFIYLQEKQSQIIITRGKLFYFSRLLDFDVHSLISEFQLNESLDKLALEIQRSFDYFQTHWRTGAPSHIVWAATKHITISLSEELSKRLSMEVQPFNPAEFMTVHPDVNPILLGRYAPLIGELLREEVGQYAPTN